MGPRGDHGLLGHEAGDERTGDRPGTKPGRGKHWGNCLGHPAVGAFLRRQLLIGKPISAGQWGRLQNEHHNHRGHNDITGGLQEALEADPHHRERQPGTRQLVGGQVDHQRLRTHAPPQGIPHGQPHQDHQGNGDQIHRKHHGAGIIREERVRQHHIHRQPGRA